MDDDVQPGLRGQVRKLVTEADTAALMGSGDLAVFATPALTALMEAAAVAALAGQLAPDRTSVGMRIDLRHLAATPIGATVRAEAILTTVSGRLLSFDITAHDEKERIGEAVHERVIVDRARFMARVASKME